MHFFIQRLYGVVSRRMVALICTAACAMLVPTRPSFGQLELDVDFRYPPTNKLSEYDLTRFANDIDLRMQRDTVQRLAAEGDIEKARRFAKAYCENAKRWVAGGDVHRNALVMAAQLELLAGNLADAEALLRQRLKLGTNYDRAAEFIKLRLAVVLHAQGHVADGHHLARQWVATIKALPAFESVIDKHSSTPRLASQLRQHADNLVLDGYLSEAALVQEAALEVYDDIAPQELVLADELAGTRIRQGSFRLALPAIKRSEELIRNSVTTNPVVRRDSVYVQDVQITREVLFSEAHRAVGNYEPWYRRAQYSGTLVVDPMLNPRYRGEKNVGVKALANGRLAAARDEFNQFFYDLRPELPLRTDLIRFEVIPESSIVLNNAAITASLSGDALTATKYADHAQMLAKEDDRSSPADEAILIANQARLCVLDCDLRKAISLSRDAVVRLTQHLGCDHPDTQIVALQLAFTLEAAGDYEAAKANYQSCQKAFVRLLGPNTTNHAYILNRLGYLAYLDGDYPLAETRLITALAIYDHAEYEHADGQLDCLRNLASLYRRTVEMDKLRAIEARLPFKSRKSTIRSISQR